MQTPDHQQPPEDEALQAPPRLVAALKRRPKAPIFIAPTIDEAVLRAAQRHLNPPKPVRRFHFWRWAAAVGMALLMLALIPQFFKQPVAEGVRSANFAGQDLNQDGRLDILDAFALARELKTGTARSPQLDLNGDGVVDERDVAVLAARAVKLEKGGAS